MLCDPHQIAAHSPLHCLCVSHKVVAASEPSSHTYLHASKDFQLLLMIVNFNPAHFVVLAIGSAGIRRLS